MGKADKGNEGRRRDLGICAALVAAVLLFSFYRSLAPDLILFANDAPLGMIAADYSHMPDGLTGLWFDLNWLGVPVPATGPGITFIVLTVLNPVLFAKFYAPLALLLFGLCAWFFLHRLKLSPTACFLGALAAALGSGPFSAACWGVAAHVLAQAWHLLALALLADLSDRRRWIRVILAGACVGMGIMEGFDVGAIFSLLVAAYVVYGALIEDGSSGRKLFNGVIRTGLVAICAAIVAAHVLAVLVLTQIQGVAGKEQDSRTKLEQWDWATQWSLPKREILGLVVPGLFGYRMDTPDGGNYWGAIGSDPHWDRYYDSLDSGILVPGTRIEITFPDQPNLNTTQDIDSRGEISLMSAGAVSAAGLTSNELARSISEKYAEQHPGIEASVSLAHPGMARFSGGASYVGVIVAVIALWAIAATFRKKDRAFSPMQTKWIWFWSVVAMVSLLLSFGRFAPFYQFLYALPYFSTIRNPAKFMSIVSLAVLVIFAYGVDGLLRMYLSSATTRAQGLVSQLRYWWDTVGVFERRWTIGMAGAITLCVAGWLIFAASKPNFIAYLQTVDFDEATARAVAAFSVKQVAWFIVVLCLSCFLIVVILSGFFAGRRRKWGTLLLGILLAGDLTLANRPWVVYWDYTQKYASNPVIDTLREEPFKHRVAILPFNVPQQYQLFGQLYRIEWTQHLFLYYNIQTLDVIQMPRQPEDMVRFETALGSGTLDLANQLLRRWQLTNTRYLLGPAGYIDVLNRQLDSDRRRFRIAETFNVTRKPDVANVTSLSEFTAVLSPSGEYALFNFDGALPRASLYRDWEVITNEQSTLSRLASPDWDPGKTVLVPKLLPAPSGNNSTNGSIGTAEFVHYSPKHIKFETASTEPAVLLLNDKYDPNWHVAIDGEPGEIFRANYIMRGVYLPSGTHTVDFSFEPPVVGLYVTISAMFVALILTGFLIVTERQQQTVTTKGELKSDSSDEKGQQVRSRRQRRRKG